MSGREDLWVILLAGGNGTRLRDKTIRGMRFELPKQFCRIGSDRSLLQIAMERARRLTDERRILAVVCDAHRAWWEPELAHLPRENVLSQPANRGNAVAIFHALFQVLRRDRNPVVVVLPSDHAVDDEEILRQAIEHATQSARQWCGPLVLLGMTPGHADPEYGWILPGPAAQDSTRTVAGFFEKPCGDDALALMRRGALWNSFIFTGTALGLLRLFDHARPDLLETYPESMLRMECDPRALERYYARLPAIDFGRDILAKSAHHLRLLPVEPCGWTDLGTPVRVEAWMERREIFAPRLAPGWSADRQARTDLAQGRK